VPDPCYWTPELPFLYSASIELVGASPANLASSEELEASKQIVQRLFGMRRLGAHQRKLIFEAAPWVPRGVVRERCDASELETARRASAVLVVPGPDDDYCRAASEIGVLLIAPLSGATEQVLSELRRLSKWPSVGIAMIDAGQDLPAAVRRHAPNMLLAASLGAASRGIGRLESAPSWAHLVVRHARDATGRMEPPHPALPEIVIRTPRETLDISAGRAACDRLQSELADAGQFAGYLC